MKNAKESHFLLKSRKPQGKHFSQNHQYTNKSSPSLHHQTKRKDASRSQLPRARTLQHQRPRSCRPRRRGQQQCWSLSTPRSKFFFPPPQKRVFLSAHPPLQLLTHSPSSQTRQIEERGIFKKIGKALGRLKGGSKWPELKAKLNAPNPNPQPHVPFSGPVINGRIKGNNGKWVKYEPGMENQ